MDQSFHNSFSGKSPFSPRSRQNISSKRILPTSFRKSSRLSLSGKSSQSVQTVMKSTHHYVERFGQSLPVLVTEALTFADRNTVFSARISEIGYAWVVCGRRLLIWQYRQTTVTPGTPQKKSGNINQCFELQLPQSDLAHRAELVAVFINAGCNTPSCIAVSPEGVVRYWPAVAHEGVTVEETVDLQGQECDSLTNIDGLGCILATTTCTIVLVQPVVNNSRHVLSCKTLRTPSGWLGGISKRMSSLIFGPISNEQSSETRLVRVLNVPNKKGTWTVYVLAGHSLQKWLLSNQESEQLLSVTELNRLVRDRFHSIVWDNWAGDQDEIDIWLLDIQADKDKDVIIFAAAVNMQISSQVYYAMITFSTGGSVSIKDFVLLKISGLYREDNTSDSLSYRFLISGSSVYMYNLKTIRIIRSSEEPDVLEFNSSQDFLLGGSICVNTPVFFSRLNGLVAVCTNDQVSDFLNQSTTSNTPIETSFNDSIVVNNLSIYNLDPEEIYNAYKDTVGQLKAAFIFHIRNQQSAYLDILGELFPPEKFSSPSVNSALDKVVVLLCKDLLDDIPAGDPRWNRVALAGIGSSYAMQVLHQLEDKQKALSLYFRFLKESEIWDRLSACITRDCVTPTVHTLGEFSEKITAAIAMKKLPNRLIIENALEKVIEDFETEPGNGLTNQDVFYREVTKVQRGIQEIVNCCEESAHSDLDPHKVAQIVTDTNEIILTVLKDVIQYRNQNSDKFVPSEATKSLKLEYLPWTATNGKEGVADALLQQRSATLNYGIKLKFEGRLKSLLLDDFVGLTDLILDGRKFHLETIKNTQKEAIVYKQYCTDRHKLIEPLLNENDYKRAALLAEKYLDFEILVTICERTNNQTRLEEYMDRFSDEGFPEFVYNWYLKQNKQGKLIDRYRNSGRTENLQKLSNFLSDHPSLSWMQQIFDKRFSTAADTLSNLANAERESLIRQKTMLSLSKLAKLASPNASAKNDFVQDINSRLELIIFQEDLPDYVLQQFGYDSMKPRVIPPNELVNLYTCSEFIDAEEIEFRKALDIVSQFIPEQQTKEELELEVWRKAILRNTWNYPNLDSPMSILRKTLFFKIIELSLGLGSDPETLLPPLDILIEDPSLHHLQENNNFKFLIKTAYDHVHRLQMLE